MATVSDPILILVMGVCGCGKTTVGSLLAERLGSDFIEGDTLHSPANVLKMSGGTPLSDEDRAGWLTLIWEASQRSLRANRSVVVACSALKERYRERLARGVQEERFFIVYLKGSEGVLQARLAKRAGHFMNPALLGSQLATLEEPAKAWVFDVEDPPASIAASVLAYINCSAARL